MDYFTQVFFHKKDLRKMHLFSLLKAASHEGIHLNELDIVSPNSRKTVYSDIMELKQDLICVYKDLLLKEENGWFRLICENTIQSQMLMCFYIKKSRNFWVFNMIVENKGISYRGLSEIMFCSQTSIYESVVKINKMLKPLGISCHTKGLMGDEKIIRHLLFETYWFLFGGIEWPFKLKREDFLSEIVKLESSGAKLKDLEKEKIFYWLAITEIRLRKGNSISNSDVKTHDKIDRKIYLTFFLEKSCGKYKRILNFEEESRFLINTIQILVDSSYHLNKNVNQVKQIDKIKYYLREKGKEAKLNTSEMKQLEIEFIKIDYYIKEDLIDWYHFLEPNCMLYFKEISILIEKNDILLKHNICEKVTSMYVLAAKKSGIYVARPISISIISREGRTSEVGQLLKRYSEYPIELIQPNNNVIDIILTDFSGKNRDKELRTPIVFYEWPLSETQVENIITTAISLKKEMVESYS